MSSLNGRVARLEMAIGQPVWAADQWHPTKPPAWSALGVLLEHGTRSLYYAGALYEAGRIDTLLSWWKKLARSERCASHVPKELRPEHWQWALEALRRALPRWKQESWWQETERDVIAEINDEH